MKKLIIWQVRNCQIWDRTHGLPFQVHTLLGYYVLIQKWRCLKPSFQIRVAFCEVKSELRTTGQWVLHHPKAVMAVLFSSWCTQTQLSDHHGVIVMKGGCCIGGLVQCTPWVHWVGETGKLLQLLLLNSTPVHHVHVAQAEH